MCVCVYVCVFVSYVCVWMCVRVCVDVSMYTLTYLHIRYTDEEQYTSTSKQRNKAPKCCCRCVRVYACVCECLRVCLCVCVFVSVPSGVFAHVHSTNPGGLGSSRISNVMTATHARTCLHVKRPGGGGNLAFNRPSGIAHGGRDEKIATEFGAHNTWVH